MKASKALTVSVSVFRGRILWRFSLSKNNISPSAPNLELILFPLWYWPIMSAHTKKQDKVFEMDFIDSQKSDPPFAHLLALSHIYASITIIIIYNLSYKHNAKQDFLFLHLHSCRLNISIISITVSLSDRIIIIFIIVYCLHTSLILYII